MAVLPLLVFFYFRWDEKNCYCSQKTSGQFAVMFHIPYSNGLAMLYFKLKFSTICVRGSRPSSGQDA